MSRGGNDDYDENFPNEWAFWERRMKLACTSKRGRKALAELREALLALPERRLVEGALSTVRIVDRAVNGWQHDSAVEKHDQEGDGVCAVGAYIWHKRVKAGMSPDEAFDSLPILLDDYSSLDETARVGEKEGLTYTLAYLLADLNDETFGHQTPEARWQRYMAWLDKELAPAERQDDHAAE